MRVTLFSFGFKHGSPASDTLLDIRFLPNPFYVPELKERSGKEPDVAAYVLDNEAGRMFLAQLEPMLISYIAGHAASGREELRLGIGCTGGRHRSVAVTEQVHRFLVDKGIDVAMHHRDIDRE